MPFNADSQSSRLTLREIGEALGISKQAVSQLKAKGMPVGSIEAARRWRESNIDLGRARDVRMVVSHGDRPEVERVPSAPAPTVAAPLAAEAPRAKLLPPGPPPDAYEADEEPSLADNAEYRRARAEREQVRLERDKLALEQERGKLIDLDDAMRMVFTSFRSLRDAVLNVPARVKDQVAALSDSFHVEQLLDRELSAALAGFRAETALADVDDDADEA